MIEKNGRPIANVEEWRVLAGPKHEQQWQVGRSAMESARAWVIPEPHVPAEIAALLESHPDFSSLTTWSAEPEAATRFDTFPGEPANLDVLVVAADPGGRVVMAVEAKADEPFGGTVQGTLQAARQRVASNPNSNGVARVEQLVQGILGATPHESGLLRYQLLTATAAAICEAERQSSDRAVLVIHEFVTDRTSDPKHAANAENLNRFVRALSGGSTSVINSGELVGPMTLPGVPLTAGARTVYVGKAVRNLRGVGV